MLIRRINIAGLYGFLDEAEMNFGPLTIICGKNGTGKSTWLGILRRLRASAGTDRAVCDFLADDPEALNFYLSRGHHFRTRPQKGEPYDWENSLTKQCSLRIEISSDVHIDHLFGPLMGIHGENTKSGSRKSNVISLEWSYNINKFGGRTRIGKGDSGPGDSHASMEFQRFVFTVSGLDEKTSLTFVSSDLDRVLLHRPAARWSPVALLGPMTFKGVRPICFDEESATEDKSDDESEGQPTFPRYRDGQLSDALAGLASIALSFFWTALGEHLQNIDGTHPHITGGDFTWSAESNQGVGKASYDPSSLIAHAFEIAEFLDFSPENWPTRVFVGQPIGRVEKLSRLVSYILGLELRLVNPLIRDPKFEDEVDISEMGVASLDPESDNDAPPDHPGKYLPGRTELSRIARYLHHLEKGNVAKLISVGIDDVRKLFPAAMMSPLPIDAQCSGVRYLLPVLIQLAFLRRGDALILDSPEAFLHPSAQGRLADVFIAEAKLGRQLILETQSDMLVRRVIRRLLDPNLKLDVDDVITVNFTVKRTEAAGWFARAEPSDLEEGDREDYRADEDKKYFTQDKSSWDIVMEPSAIRFDYTWRDHVLTPPEREVHGIGNDLDDFGISMQILGGWFVPTLAVEELDIDRLRRGEIAFPSGFLSDLAEEEAALRNAILEFRQADERRSALESLEAASLDELLKMGENQHLEFKSTMLWDKEKRGRNEDLTTAVLRTIAGFLNSQEGGVLLIGITDEGEVSEIDDDIKLLKKKNLDGHRLFLTDKMSIHLGQAMPPIIKITYPELRNKQICKVVVPPGPFYVFYRSAKQEDAGKFFLRSQNSTRELSAEEAFNYMTQSPRRRAA